MTEVPEIVFDQWPDDQMTTWPNILSMKKCDLRKIGNQRGKGENGVAEGIFVECLSENVPSSCRKGR